MSSDFGYGTFKQRLLDYIVDECRDEGYDLFRGIEEVMEVVSYLSGIAFQRDEALKKIYEKAKEDARRELIEKLR